MPAVADDNKPFHTPFDVLKRLRPETAEPAAKEAPAVTSAKGVPRAVVRLERAGRKGKVVTVVEHLGLDVEERDRWLTALKAALGCGGAIENNMLVFQGDQRHRLPTLLTTRGVKKVTVST
jgi:translation initiation factor 1